ncbi:hypothetical protein HBI56_055040 [Parastagonospora nodorum]|uniref:Uncharacterized protein n=1 Tax=Phaeosphaeria nodorum (strain SN15 / ATCC MYA-4574 / FGSC 10173) TaxID=321614 RepID=A0A7U2ICU2_PHANO|nr:hypothetical protein HBH56_097100 [Parastagonospora nodorum]QRD07295.1 hypothetical protein JI435_447190 [Parastagonospora nodorum SN15]KAH3930337.1 hypothetical protein HBH54_111420 [Parastagonospora nodorum]KAH3945034.1 hypothetical protein HBH53_148010 [Parastagonospora nodorum]KAH4003122.1 hypothetical protein HBI10_068030 [Parastagonospora nodorum]
MISNMGRRDSFTDVAMINNSVRQFLSGLVSQDRLSAQLFCLISSGSILSQGMGARDLSPDFRGYSIGYPSIRWMTAEIGVGSSVVKTSMSARRSLLGAFSSNLVSGLSGGQANVPNSKLYAGLHADVASLGCYKLRHGLGNKIKTRLGGVSVSGEIGIFLYNF